MIHYVQTNVVFNTEADTQLVLKVVLSKVENDQLCNITFMKNALKPIGSCIKVKVEGNGALLRDVAFALDVAGMLD